MQSSIAVVLGATGLIGEQLVQQLLNDPAFSKVRILVRRAVQLSHPKLEVALVDFNNLSDYKDKLGTGDVIFCCIGTTQKKVQGDKIQYRKVDFDIPVNAAQMGLEAGFKTYVLVSSVGADAKGGNFYLKLKGEVEDAIANHNYNSFYIFQPSILLGERTEVRFGELIGKFIMKGLSFLFAGPLKKYKGIEARDVAKAMVAAAKSGKQGTLRYQYEEMMQLIM